jgi:hypothetical protein
MLPHIVEAAIKATKAGYTHYTVNAGFSEFRKAVPENLLYVLWDSFGVARARTLCSQLLGELHP